MERQGRTDLQMEVVEQFDMCSRLPGTIAAISVLLPPEARMEQGELRKLLESSKYTPPEQVNRLYFRLAEIASSACGEPEEHVHPWQTAILLILSVGRDYEELHANLVDDLGELPGV